MAIINEEMVPDKQGLEIQLMSTEKSLESLKHKRDKHYDIIESGKLEIEDIAPRLRDLNHQIDIQERNHRQTSK